MGRAFILILLILHLLVTGAKSQGLTCETSDPFCTGTIYNFPAGTSGTAQSGPYYGCLATQPAPAWYHMRIGNPGPITIYMYSTPLRDIDFICWGPFDDPYTACAGGLTQAKVVDCSYSIYPEEWCDIPNGQTGEYYILLITNYSQQPCNITFSQTGGTGSTDCTILPPLINNNGPLCVGETLNLTAETIANASYSWTGPNGFSSTQQNPVISPVTLDNAGEYTCIITITGQTSTPAVTLVEVNDLPDASLVYNSATTCQGEPTYMLVNLTGAGPFEVFYNNGSGYFIATGLNGPVDTIFLFPPGPMTYTLTQVSDTNCSKTLSGLTFQVLNHPAATGILTGSSVICEGDTAQLVFNLTGTPTWTITYLVNGGNPQTVTATATPWYVPVSPSTTTQYQFSQLSDAYCTGTASGQALITVNHVSGFLSGNNNICSGSSTTLLFALYGYPPWTITYTQNGIDPQTVVATSSPYSLVVAPLVTTLYEFTEVEDLYCSGEASGQALVAVNLPTGSLTGADSICSGETAYITFELTGTPPWTIEYTANGGNPVSVTAYVTPYHLAVSPTVTTLYTFTYFADSDCPGTATGEALITVFPNPAASAGPDMTIPNGTSTTLQGQVSGGSGNYIYSWQPADKLVNPGALQPQTVNLYATTLYSLEVTDQTGGCQGSDNVLVTVAGGVLSCNPYALPATICRGQQTQLHAMVSGGSGNYTCQWASDPPGFVSDLPNPVILPETSTTYYLTVNDGYNIVSGTVLVTVHPLPVPDAGPDQVIPFGTPTILHGSATSGSGNYAYQWQPAEKLVSANIPDPATLNLVETTMFALDVSDLATGCICEQPDAMTVYITGDMLSANPVAAPATICSGETTRLFALAGGGTGIYTYSWTSNPPGFSSFEADPVVSPGVNTVYSLIISDSYNIVTGNTSVTVNPTPVVNLGADTTVCVFDLITLDAGNAGADFLWNNGSPAQTITAGSTGIGFDVRFFSVTVTSIHGCQGTASITIYFDFSACSGINDQLPEKSLTLFPNPGNGLVYLHSSSGEGSFLLTIIDGRGQIITGKKEINLSPDAAIIISDLIGCTDGLYLIRITDNSGKHFNFKYLLSK